jgi:hypothetical protein
VKTLVQIVLFPVKMIVFFLMHTIRWLGNTLVMGKPTFRVEIIFGWGRAAIHSDPDSSEGAFSQLVTAYLLFLSEYFYICDEIQRLPARDLLMSHINEGSPPYRLTEALAQMARQFLSKAERSAFELSFKSPKDPPTYLNNDCEIPKIQRFGRYVLTTYYRGGHWARDLKVSFGYTTILLPLTIGLLYDYVIDQIGQENRNIFDACIVDLLDMTVTPEGRGYIGADRIVNEVIARRSRSAFGSNSNLNPRQRHVEAAIRVASNPESCVPR